MKPTSARSAARGLRFTVSYLWLQVLALIGGSCAPARIDSELQDRSPTCCTAHVNGPENEQFGVEMFITAAPRVAQLPCHFQAVTLTLVPLVRRLMAMH